MIRDLEHSEYHPPEVPAWACTTYPKWVRPFVGIDGMPAKWQPFFDGPNAAATAGLDRYQANHFINWRSETAVYLEKDYTPLKVGYVPGTFPQLEALARECTINCLTAEQKAEAILKGPSRNLRHPRIPDFKTAFGDEIDSDRNLSETELLANGKAWCNEQARVFVRLCQTQNIPARIIHLFYNRIPGGHTVAEFHNGSQWCLADASYLIIFRDDKGQCLAAADCHDRGAGQKRYGEQVFETVGPMIKAGLKIPEGKRDLSVRDWLKWHGSKTPELCSWELDFFGVINYPLPVFGPVEIAQ